MGQTNRRKHHGDVRKIGLFEGGELIQMFQFSLPWIFALLPLPALIYFLIPKANHTGAALRVPFYYQVNALSAENTGSRRTLKITILIFCWALLVVACARPQWLGKPGDMPISGRDLMLAVDVSGSMKARDMIFQGSPQNRLDAVKRVAGEFIQRRTGDRIGLILFGTRAYLQAPLSLDRKTIDQLLQEAVIGIAGEKTAVGDAIGLALKRLKDREGDEKVLILLTDGSQTAGEIEPLQAAQLATLGGLRIHTIGVGGGGNSQGGLFSRRSDLDEPTLRQVSKITGGQFFRAIDAASLQNIYGLIDELEPVVEDTSHLRPITELFYWPLSLALIISLIWALTVTSGVWLGGINSKIQQPRDSVPTRINQRSREAVNG